MRDMLYGWRITDILCALENTMDTAMTEFDDDNSSLDITPEMEKAGVLAIEQFGDEVSAATLASLVFRAMEKARRSIDPECGVKK